MPCDQKENNVAWVWELLAGPDSITEGPAWDGEGLFYTAIAHNEIRRYDPTTNEITTIYRDSGAANGLLLASDGTLLACEGGRRALAAYHRNGTRTTLVDRFEGRRL